MPIKAAFALKRGDLVTHHPDHPDREGEWVIQRNCGLNTATGRVWLDYRTSHGEDGVFVLLPTHPVHVEAEK